jgi:hypothetical protein
VIVGAKEGTLRRTLALRKDVPRRSHHATISGVHSSVTKSDTENIAAPVRQRLANLAQTQATTARCFGSGEKNMERIVSYFERCSNQLMIIRTASSKGS